MWRETELWIMSACPLKRGWGLLRGPGSAEGALRLAAGSFLRGVQLRSAVGPSRGACDGDGSHCPSAEPGSQGSAPLSAAQSLAGGLSWSEIRVGGECILACRIPGTEEPEEWDTAEGLTLSLGPLKGPVRGPEGILNLEVGRAGSCLKWRAESGFFSFACQEAHSRCAVQLLPVTRALSYLSVRTGCSCLF